MSDSGNLVGRTDINDKKLGDLRICYGLNCKGPEIRYLPREYLKLTHNLGANDVLPYFWVLEHKQ